MYDLHVDYTLTPENCEEKGFEWYGDSIYDAEAPEGTMDDLKDAIEDGWKLGSPASSLQPYGGIGVYKPLTQNKKLP